MQSFARGGEVERTGPAFLHRGEFVLPADRSALEINLNASVNVTLRSSNRAEADRYAREFLLPAITDAIENNRERLREVLRSALNRR
jgi:hypothetical protein